jgi:hypothetical protein
MMLITATLKVIKFMLLINIAIQNNENKIIKYNNWKITLNFNKKGLPVYYCF